jgi:hypothetical protein
MAHEYDGQRLAIQRAENEGKEAQNSLEAYRKMFNNEDQADLAWEIAAGQKIMDRIKAAYVSARSDSEKNNLMALWHYKQAEQETANDAYLASVMKMSNNPELINRSSMATNTRPGVNTPMGRGLEQPSQMGKPAPQSIADRASSTLYAMQQRASGGTPSAGGAAPSGGIAGYAPVVQGGQAFYPSLMQQGARKAMSGEAGNPIVAEVGGGSMLGQMVQSMSGTGGEGLKIRSTGHGVAPEGMATRSLNGILVIGPGGKEAEDVSADAKKYAKTVSAVKSLDSKLEHLARLQKDFKFWDNFDKKKRNELETAYQAANQDIMGMGSAWFKNNVDPSTLQKNDLERIDKNIPNLSYTGGQLTWEQVQAFKSLRETASSMLSRSRGDLDSSLAANGWSRANTAFVKINQTPVKDASGKWRHDWDVVPGSTSGAVQFVWPGGYTGGMGIDSRGTKR